MGLVSLVVRDFRNLRSAELNFSPTLNLIVGPNGAGKTSLLEALYFLGRGRSFRTSYAAPLIREGASGFLLHGCVDGPSGQRLPIGMSRDANVLRVRLGGQPLRRLSELLPYFPFQVVTPDSHQLLQGGPRYRRRFLDWGLFHVEPTFFPEWQRYSQALKQRNAALRAKSPKAEVQLWDRELIESGLAIEGSRRRYLDQLLPTVEQTVADLVGITTIKWEYRAGWNRRLSFAEALDQSFEGDRFQRVTRTGPHRADLFPSIAGEAVHERVSRGQQKQIVIALMLAQAAVYRQRTGRMCIFLIDDLASELDTSLRGRIWNQLRSLQAQVFLSAIEPSLLDLGGCENISQFHVEQGQILSDILPTHFEETLK